MPSWSACSSGGTTRSVDERTSNFLELRACELLRIPLPRTSVNKHGVVYLGAVHPGEDDYRELTDLLFGARERHRSVRATVRHSRRGILATEAINRYVEYAFRNNILSNFDPPYDEPRYREYADLEEI